MRRYQLSVYKGMILTACTCFSAHLALLNCMTDPLTYRCTEVCGTKLSCAHSVCRGRCSDCIALQQQGSAFGHVRHAHEKVKACGHVCRGSCFDHVLNKSCDTRCTDLCTRSCAHGTCKVGGNEHTCAEPCPSCLQPCDTPGCVLPCASPCNVEGHRVHGDASRVRLPVPLSQGRAVRPSGVPAALGQEGPSSRPHYDDDSRRLRPERSRLAAEARHP